ncbi:pentatricopeptide repeat-containing protein At5g11310, mitochondrial-like [Lolium rigidum]|uniref:pentatricopeptide repeat-containing protein At5g11310, mitochondrial-like n=1 Tax=Lolium rigidum TaxID=89674 RepID=UPI001F5D04A1|nr:pentatricopeptide repeat-containing protein At5g11310, mitochondrial-like [Lolium rigidum]
MQARPAAASLAASVPPDASAAAAAVVSILSDAEDPDDRLRASGISPDPALFPHLRRSLTALPESAFPALFRWAGAAAAVSLLASRGLFAASWRLLLSPASPPPPLSAFAPLVRRYARLGRAPAALRAFHFLRRHPNRFTPDDAAASPAATSLLNMAVGALCKEGHPRPAARLVERCRREGEASPDERTYNMLLDGWSGARRLDKVRKLWSEMRQAGVRPTVVSYGTLIKALCLAQQPDQAACLLDEMRGEGIDANLLTCNPIVNALAHAGRFRDAYKLLEKFPLYGVAPNISTFNSLVLGYCKYGDLAGASGVLKAMMGRGILPTAKTYNYFFIFFAKTGNVELGMNLYSKMVNNGYAPDQVTYNLLIKLLSEANRVELVVQMIKEMKANGFESDLATSTMLVHLLCRTHRFEEACAEFQDMFRRGLVPQYITYRMLMKELKRLGSVELVDKLTDLMRSVPHSTKLPGSYREKEGDDAKAKRKLILEKAQAVSNVLKECKDPKELHKLKDDEETDVQVADRLVASIRKRVYGGVSMTLP